MTDSVVAFAGAKYQRNSVDSLHNGASLDVSDVPGVYCIYPGGQICIQSLVAYACDEN